MALGVGRGHVVVDVCRVSLLTAPLKPADQGVCRLSHDGRASVCLTNRYISYNRLRPPEFCTDRHRARLVGVLREPSADSHLTSTRMLRP
jgi:hypothetical protein